MAVDPDGARHAPPSTPALPAGLGIAAIRTFVAVLLPPDLRERLGREIDGLRRHPGVAWVASDNLHITLKFLGGVDEPRLPEIVSAVATAASTPAFEVLVRGLGAFPSESRPRVIWVGSADAPGFARLAGDVDRALAPLGFPAEARGFTPHVTLGRVREPRRDPALTEALRAGADRHFGTLRVDRVSLMRSDLSPRGARYTELAGFALPPWS